jgi:hypothetical protein
VCAFSTRAACLRPANISAFAYKAEAPILIMEPCSRSHWDAGLPLYVCKFSRPLSDWTSTVSRASMSAGPQLRCVVAAQLFRRFGQTASPNAKLARPIRNRAEKFQSLLRANGKNPRTPVIAHHSIQCHYDGVSLVASPQEVPFLIVPVDYAGGDCDHHQERL